MIKTKSKNEMLQQITIIKTKQIKDSWRADGK